MDPLPGIGLVKTFSTGAQGSMRSAGALWDSVGDVGQMIAAVGDKGVALLNRHKELEVQREAATMELEFDQMAQEYEMEILKNPNITPEQAAEGWGKRSQQFTAKYQRDGMSPLQQDVIANRSKDLVAKGGFSALKAATIASIQNTKQAAINLINRGEETGNTELIERGFSMMGQVMPEADLEAQKMETDRRMKHKADLAEIDSDPFAAREKYEGEAPEGEDPTEHAKKRDYMRSRIAGEQNAIIDGINEGLASGKITRPDQLDRFTDQIGAASIQRIKSSMAAMTDDKRKAMVETPAYQARIIGMVSAAISELKPDDIARRVEIESKLRDVAPGASKDLLSADLKRKLGNEPEDYSPMSRARTMLNAAFRQGAFGPVTPTKPQTTDDVIKDDFFQDGAKLQALGITQEWSDKIQDPETSEKDRVRLFTEAMRARPKDAKITADDYTRRAADAIVNRKNAIPKTDEEKSKEFRNAWDALRKKGEIEKQLTDWHKAHPDGDVEAQMMRLLGDADSERVIDAAESEGIWFDINEYEPGAEFAPLPGMEPGQSGSSDILLPSLE